MRESKMSRKLGKSGRPTDLYCSWQQSYSMHSQNLLVYRKTRNLQLRGDALEEVIKQLVHIKSKLIDSMGESWNIISAKERTTTENLIFLHNRSSFDPDLSRIFLKILEERSDANKVVQEDDSIGFY
jgi:hypothetical protein